MTFGRQLAALERDMESVQREIECLQKVPWTMSGHSRERFLRSRLAQMDRDYRALRGRGGEGSAA